MKEGCEQEEFDEVKQEVSKGEVGDEEVRKRNQPSVHWAGFLPPMDFAGFLTSLSL